MMVLQWVGGGSVPHPLFRLLEELPGRGLFRRFPGARFNSRCRAPKRRNRKNTGSSCRRSGSRDCDPWALRAEFIEPEIRALMHEVIPESPMYRIFTMAGLAQRSMALLSFTMLMLAIASGLALVLAAVGLYGVLSYVVAHRAQEIAVRMALGAEAPQVRRMIEGGVAERQTPDSEYRTMV